MFLSQSDKEILNNLKGRISKLLSKNRKISVEDRTTSEKIYKTIDKLILLNKQSNGHNYTHLRNILCSYKGELNLSKNEYIQKHILPLLSRVLNTRETEKDE